MPPSETSGSPSGARAQFFPDDIGLTPNFDQLGTPISPIIRFRWVSHFAASLRFAYAAAYRVVHPLGGSDQVFTRPQGFLRPSFRTSRSPSSSSGMATVVSEHFHRWFSTTGATASIAAPRLWLITFLDRPVHSFVSGTGRVSRFSRVEVPCMSEVFDLAGPVSARDSAPTSVAFPPNKQRRHPDFQIFRGSIPSLHVPLSTLRDQPLDWPCMTRGSVWLAMPSPYGSFIRSSTPV